LRKGATFVLEALARVPELRLVFVAHGRSDAWQALARELNVQERATFCAGTNAIERYYAAADLLVFPTFHDAFGLVVSEAMASGLPVIVSRHAGAAELINNGLEGFVLRDPNDTTELVAVLTRLVADADLRARVGAAARRRISTFTWDRTATETLAVYRELLGRRLGRKTEKSLCL
jgi:UDP-glucose:(heptosyl)LPS alpha-1,3-glucosyltransferase